MVGYNILPALTWNFVVHSPKFWVPDNLKPKCDVLRFWKFLEVKIVTLREENRFSMSRGNWLDREGRDKGADENVLAI